MGVLEFEHYSYPVDDAPLAQLQALLPIAFRTRSLVEVILHFGAEDRIRVPITPSSRYTLYIRRLSEVCDGCVRDLLAEWETSGCVNLVAGDVPMHRTPGGRSVEGQPKAVGPSGPAGGMTRRRGRAAASPSSFA